MKLPVAMLSELAAVLSELRREVQMLKSPRGWHAHEQICRAWLASSAVRTEGGV